MHRSLPIPARAGAPAAGPPAPAVACAPVPAVGPRPVGPPTAARRCARPSCAHRRATLRERGQGTVEYVALVLLVAGILAAAVATAGKGFKPGQLAETVATKINQSISQVSGKAPSGGAAR